MPVVTIDIVQDSFTPAQKQEIIARITEALVAVEGEAMRALTWVRINEIAAGDSAIGGQPLDVDALCRFAALADDNEDTAPGSMRQTAIRRLLAAVTDFTASAASSTPGNVRKL